MHDDNEFEHILPEAEARAEGDWLMGINYSRFLTLSKGGNGAVLTYGRCQTPLLYLIYKRDKAIAQFVSTPFYNLQVNYQQGFTGILVDDEGKKWDILNKDDAQKLQQQCEGSFIITKYQKEQKSKKPPLLYNLAALQKTMGTKYDYTPDQTLEIAQSLYEKHKILSYPRTDSQYLSMDVFGEIKEHLNCCNFGEYLPYIKRIESVSADKRYFNDLKVTDHHALIPTINANMEKTYRQLSEKEKNVFDAVVRSFIAIFLPNYIYDVTEIVARVNGLNFVSRGVTTIADGYKVILATDIEEEKNTEDSQLLPILNEGDTLSIKDTVIQDKMTKPPKSYTISTLIGVMEKHSIGTSATRAEIINKLMDPKHPYIILEKNKYCITQLGADFIQVIPEELKSERLTEAFEEKLSLINEGHLSKEDFLAGLIRDINANMQQLSTDDTAISFTKKSIGKCPICGALVYENSKAYGCSEYKNGCKFSIWKTIAGKNISASQAELLLSKGSVGPLKGFKSKSGKIFTAALVVKEDKTIGFKFS